jgi:hypothetical protein
MNKKILIPIIVIVLILVGIGAFFILQKYAFPEPPIVQITQKDIISIASPFGMSGAFSRPFVPNDTFPPEKIYQMISQLEEPYKHVQDIGIKWIRPGVDIAWQLVQPTKEHVENGSYEWVVIDNLYGNVPSGVNTLANVCTGRQGMKSGTWEFVNRHVEEKYLEFVKKVVERYDGDGIDDMPGLKSPVKYWQIENEPAFFYGPNYDWQGFSHLVEITYKIIKENSPEAKVALGGLAVGFPVNPNDPLFEKAMGEQKFYISLLNNLKGKYIDIFVINYYGNPKEWPNEWRDIWNWKDMREIYNVIREKLNDNGYKNTEIWFTEIATPSKPYGEKAQAISLIKRYIYPLSFGVKKIFWWNMIEGEYPLEVDKPSNHFGLVYDGIGKNDLGYGVKKLSYYTYKKVIEVLEGSDWNNIQIIQESDDIYIYKFTKNKKSIYVAWTNNDTKKQVVIEGINSSVVKITEAVPKYKSGKDVKD